jgi:hypothetical protein
MKTLLRRIAMILGTLTGLRVLVTNAYIDPGSGGMLFQLLAVLFAFLSGFIFFFARQIKTFFARFRRYLSDRFDRQ